MQKEDVVTGFVDIERAAERIGLKINPLEQIYDTVFNYLRKLRIVD